MVSLCPFYRISPSRSSHCYPRSRSQAVVKLLKQNGASFNERGATGVLAWRVYAIECSLACTVQLTKQLRAHSATTRTQTQALKHPPLHAPHTQESKGSCARRRVPGDSMK